MTTSQGWREDLLSLRVFLLYGYVLALVAPSFSLRADIVEMQNGDKYAGNVLSLDANSLALQSDVLGRIKLPRSQIARVCLGQQPTDTRASAAPALPQPPNRPVTNVSEFSRELAVNSNLVNQIQSQFLGGAGPEANSKFQELMGGLMSGKLTMSDLRKEAKGAADQLRDLQKELGESGAGVMDGYLAILDNFLKEAAPTGQPVGTNAARGNGVTPQR